MLGESRLVTLALSCSLLGLVGCGSGSALSSSPALPGAGAPLSTAAGASAATSHSATAMSGQRIAVSAKPAGAQPPLFYDDFSDGKATAWNATAGTWSVCQPSSGAPYAYCATGLQNNTTFAGSPSWTDYSLTVAVLPTFAYPPAHVREGLDIMVRAADANHFDELEIMPEHSGAEHWHILRSSPQGYASLGSGHVSVASGTMYWLRLSATGSQFTAFISTDGQHFTTLGTVTDSAYPTGGIGLRTWGGMTASYGPVAVASTGTAAPPSPEPTSPPSGPMTSETPSQADAFVNSVGVDSHFVYSQQVYSTNYPVVSQLLINSGIKHLRDSGPAYDQVYISKMAMLSAHGIHHSVGFGLKTTAAQMSADLKALGPSNIDFVEPQNEYDTYRDPNWASTIVAEQKLIWNTLRADPAFNGITILGPALAQQRNYAVMGPLDAYEDAGNLHNATCDLNPATSTRSVSIANMTTDIRASTVSKPIWTTETGYADRTASACQTPDAVIAKYDPRLIAERWNAGEPRSYIFSFADDASDPIFGSMGLISVNGTAKPQYTAIQSMLNLLADPGAPFSPTTVSYSLTGQTQNVHHILLQKRDGSRVLMLWIEKPAINGTQNASEVPIAVPSQQVSLSVPGLTAATDYAYDTSKWTISPQSLSVNAGTVNVTVTDTISFVRF